MSLHIRWFFFFFTISGFCSLVYEIVWLRLAMAQFGVNTVLTSLFLSLFMAGLGLGSWGAGKLLRGRGFPPSRGLRLYVLAECLAALGAVLVPTLFSWGHELLNAGGFSAWGSLGYYLACGACLAAALLPWCVCMGATIPFAQFTIQKCFPRESEKSFSYLYLANVLGAASGALLSAFALIELFGFAGTLLATAVLNVLMAAIAYRVSFLPHDEPIKAAEPLPRPDVSSPRHLLGLLFLTGCVSMAMEVIWTRQLIPYLGLHIYSFASILALYLLAANLGSFFYRRSNLRPDARHGGVVLALAGLSGAMTLVFADPRLPVGSGILGGALRLFLCVTPLSAAVGFLTPLLIDLWSRGDPEKTGVSYAVNILGCIAGPLLAGFLLLPWMGERWAVLAALSPLFIAAIALQARKAGVVLCAAAAGLAVILAVQAKDFSDSWRQREVLRDATATVVATEKGMKRWLGVNGVGVTRLAAVTKWMAHLPLAYLPYKPQNALVICFGMGTTFRSLLSWDVDSTAVELVPSVPKLFWYFHDDAREILDSPKARVVIDDGRRFLERTREEYDVITLDPAPPLEAAGNSLLYTVEFYALAKKRLKPDGILQHWYWSDNFDPVILGAAVRALTQSFPYVKVFHINENGFQFLASRKPIARLTPAQLAKRFPAKAAADLLEWVPKGRSPAEELKIIHTTEFPIETLLATTPELNALHDDAPLNEYYLLRRSLRGFYLWLRK